MEGQRRLECKFSVVKFGERAHLLKKIEEPLTEGLGEAILEAFSFDEGTNLMAGVAKALELGFGANRPGISTHRCVIVLTDGFVNTHEEDRRAYQAILLRAQERFGTKPNFCIVGVMDEYTASQEDGIMRGMHFLSGQSDTMDPSRNPFIALVDTRPISALAKRTMMLELQRVLVHQFHSVVKATETGIVEGIVCRGVLPWWVAVPDDAAGLRFDQFTQSTEDTTDPLYPSSGRIACNFADAHIPQGEKLFTGAAAVTGMSVADTMPASEVDARLSDCCRGGALSRKVEEARDVWRSLETGILGRVVDELQEALGTAVLPQNRYTRRRPDFAGSSLSPRGLIRFFLTNGSDAKIYLKLNAGAKREYNIALVVDRSASMKGQALAQIQAVCATMMALKALDLDSNTCIVAFGDTVEIVKPCGVSWDLEGRYAMSLLATLSSMDDSATLDADGIAVAASLLRGGSRGPSFIFVFSDGYGCRGLRLTATLSDLAGKGITVAGISVGSDGTQYGHGLSTSYAHWLACNRVSLLPSAIKAWGNTLRGLDSGASTAPDAAGAMSGMTVGDASAAEVNRVMATDHGVFFKNLDAQLNEQRTVFVTPGGTESGGGVVEIDVAFLMDCT